VAICALFKGGHLSAEYATVIKKYYSLPYASITFIGAFMANDKTHADTPQSRWARFRFSIIGPLLSAPPEKGELKTILTDLSKKQWRHPITGLPVTFSFSTIERWLYKARAATDPVNVLRAKRRTDAARPRKLSSELKCIIQQQYRDHSSWSYQLHYDNLATIVKNNADLGDLPTYHTVRRYMKANGLCKQRRIQKRNTAGALMAAERLESREVRSFEMDYVHSLWHLDFHHGSRKILDKQGQWRKPLLLAILDDHSRLICHAHGKNVGRACPNTDILTQSFCQEVKRRQRKSDGTLTLDGCRFEVPSHYRHLETLTVRYARWNLSRVMLVDTHTNKCLEALYPQDKSANAKGLRRGLKRDETAKSLNTKTTGIAPLLKDLMADYSATGLPPAYLPKSGESA
jgi:hypothetical protein